MTTPSLPDLLTSGAHLLSGAGVPSPAADARLLAAHVLGCSPAELLVSDQPTPEQVRRYAELLDRRAARVPLQHLTGRTGFRYLDLEVRPGVFIPRPETESVAQAAIDLAVAMPVPAVVVDLCCGAGPLAVSIATEVPGVLMSAVDVNPEAVLLTARNARRAGVAAIRLEQGDVADAGLLADLDDNVDVVVSNPPYIPPDAEPVEPEVRDHDPANALYGGGADGLALPEFVINAAERLLRPGGWLVMEHADSQGAATRALAEQAGFSSIQTRADLTGRDRMLVARLMG